MNTIALVDDDQNILTSVSIALEAEGFDVRTVVPGDLTEWSMTVDGDWIGRVTYQLMSKDRCETVTHWVPSRVLKRLH